MNQQARAGVYCKPRHSDTLCFSFSESLPFHPPFPPCPPWLSTGTSIVNRPLRTHQRQRKGRNILGRCAGLFHHPLPVKFYLWSDQVWVWATTRFGAESEIDWERRGRKKTCFGGSTYSGHTVPIRWGYKEPLEIERCTAEYGLPRGCSW